MAVTIYHNPRCSKSREALQLLQEKSVQPQIIEYLKNPPSVVELKNIIKLLGILAIDLVRKKEDAYKESGLNNSSSDAEVIKILAKNPVLIERPIVISGNKAAIGRPTENILKVL